MNTLINLNNITRSYTRGEEVLTVLNDISLSIDSGEFVAIVGTSGSGKSTLMNIMGFLDTPDSGDYFFNGRHTSHLSLNELATQRREHIGFIFQRYHLMSDLTAVNNVEIPAIYSGCHRDIRNKRAMELLSRLGLSGREYHFPSELSGGQQQRVCIARALMNGGEVILADEPTGALDSTSGQEVLTILNELNQLGHTIVIVTHDMQVAQHAQRIIKLSDGKIVSDKKTIGLSSNYLLLTSPPSSTGEQQNSIERIRESFLMALRSMNAHRLRTMLTMIGIIFGIAAVVSVVALGEGAKQKTLDNIRFLGSSTVVVFPGANYGEEENNPLLPSDLKKLEKIPGIDSISPEVSTTEHIVFKQRSTQAEITGVGQNYFRVSDFPLLQGRLFNNDHRALQEIILDENAVKELFPSTGPSPIGQIITVGVVPVKVVGVVKNTRDSGYGSVSGWLPYLTVMYRISGNTSFTGIRIRVANNENMDVVTEKVRIAMFEQHKKINFRIFNEDKYRRSYEKSAIILSLLIFSVASVALLIGSLGVMNIMLVSVTERTHEIGVRMAVGARRSDIMSQFMIEAVLMCLIGGLLGIFLSIIMSLVFSLPSINLPAIYSWQSAVVAFACSTIIGIIFGWLPARKAASMDPITALAAE